MSGQCIRCEEIRAMSKAQGHRNWRDFVCHDHAASDLDLSAGGATDDDWQYLGEDPQVECIKFRCKTHSGAICMLQVPEGWTWAIDCHRLSGDVLGYAEPIGRRGGRIRADRLAPSRDLALTGAIAAIRSRMPDKPLAEWLDTLAPDQPDLFGAAA